MTEIPTPDPSLVPIGALLPGMMGDPTPPGFILIDGQTLLREKYPEIVDLYWHAYNDSITKAGAPDIFDWWTRNGGVIEEHRIVLPVLTEEEVQKAVFGFVMKLTTNKPPVIWVRVTRDE